MTGRNTKIEKWKYNCRRFHNIWISSCTAACTIPLFWVKLIPVKKSEEVSKLDCLNREENSSFWFFVFPFPSTLSKTLERSEKSKRKNIRIGSNVSDYICKYFNFGKYHNQENNNKNNTVTKCSKNDDGNNHISEKIIIIIIIRRKKITIITIMIIIIMIIINIIIITIIIIIMIIIIMVIIIIMIIIISSIIIIKLIIRVIN